MLWHHWGDEEADPWAEGDQLVVNGHRSITLPFQLDLDIWVGRGARDRCRLELNRLLEVEARVREKVNLVVDVDMDGRVLVDCLQVG